MKYILFLVLIFSFCFVSAIPNDAGNKIDFTYPTIINYSLIPTVNSSDYWDALDTPADINVGDLGDGNSYVPNTNFTWFVPYTGATKNVNIGAYNLTGGTYNTLSIISSDDWIYLSGDGSTEEGLDIAIPIYAGRDFYYGYGGAEDHHFGIASALTIASDGDLSTTGEIKVGSSLIVNEDTNADVGLELRGSGTSGATRGGVIHWYTSIDGAIDSWMFVNIAKRLVFKDSAQSSATDTGNAWIDFDDGSAQFSELTTTGNITASYFIGDGSLLHSINVSGDYAQYQFGANNFNGSGNFTTTGRVGIGINYSSSSLHIKGETPGVVGSHHAGQLIIQAPTDSLNSNVVITAYESDGDGNPDQQLWYLGSASSSNPDIIFLNRRNANLKLGTNGNTRMIIKNNGRVGIGTESPGAPLEVTGDVWIFESAGDPRILVGDSASSGQWGGLDWDSTSDYLQIIHSGYSGSDGAINILSSGNVGIGTATPGQKLVVVGDLNVTGDANIGGDVFASSVNSTSWKNVTDLTDTLYEPKSSAGNMVMKFTGGKFYMKVS